MEKDLRKEFKKKKIAKYITIAIVILFAAGVILRFSIEDADGIFEKKEIDGNTAVVTVEIVCYELLDNLDKVKNESLKEYIPTDGIILPATVYEGTTETTVFDVLEYICRNKNIHMEFKTDSVYNSKYVNGIAHLYERDAGTYSGWKFSINGQIPNYGSSSVYLTDGDAVQWFYTCKP